MIENKNKKEGWRIVLDMIVCSRGDRIIGEILKRKRRNQIPAGVSGTLRRVRPSISI